MSTFRNNSVITMMCSFSREYFEDGPASGLSLYKDYRWLPELTIPMAASIAQHLGFHAKTTCLDYGCAKGFLVKALLYLGYDAYGYDISEYAVNNCDPEVTGRVFSSIDELKLKTQRIDWVISKDVLEHIPYEQLPVILKLFRSIANRCLIIVPLSSTSGDSPIAPEYNADKTHIIREPVEWWVNLFLAEGFTIDSLSFSMTGVKSTWFSRYPTANLFIQLSS